MRYLLVVTLVLSLAGAATCQVQHLKFTQTGQFANASGSTDPNSTFELSVSTTSGTSGSSTSLSFEFISVVGTSETFTLIDGLIPDASFTGQNTSSLSLNLDTSTLDPTVVFSITCTIDLITFIQTCTEPAAPGIIQLQFAENDVQRSQILALERVDTMGPVTIRTHQKADTGSGTVQGTIFGAAVTSATATLGVNHTSTLEMISTM
ncbi:MAG TPA: hypothetical protein VKW06_12705 [Candidatus Angelobacter sp.]|nr:hypothetical protein [Candidatus Angelobacter sp.]